jgi:hypothetical protein
VASLRLERAHVPAPVPSSTMIVPAAAAATANTMTQSLFCYGTLMAPAVTQTLLGRLPTSAKAVLQGSDFRRHPVRSQVYPGLVRVSGSNSNSNTAAAVASVDGIIYYDLSPTEIKVLDWYEDDDDYTRTDCNVLVFLNNNDEKQAQQQHEQMIVKTQVYVWNTADDTHLHMDREWSFSEFEESSLEWFLEHTVRPCRQELDRLGM